MLKENKLLITGFTILLFQVVIFSDHLSPIQWGQLKVSGLACTCPDESVDKGRLYLRSITPDSLKKYELDYSEVYVTERPSTKFDYMGVDQYIVKGEVVGKDRVSEYDPWNLIIKVDEWREIDLLKDLVVKIVFFGELIGLMIIYLRKREKKHIIQTKVSG